jgi:hypothetical protein
MPLARYKKTRYGELPFRKAYEAKASEPFSYDAETVLTNPTKEDLAWAWKGRVSDEHIESYWKKIEKRDDRTLSFVFGDGKLWVKGIGFQNRGPMTATLFHKETLDGYRKLSYENLRGSFSEAMTDEHIAEILNRRDQILKVAAEN